MQRFMDRYTLCESPRTRTLQTTPAGRCGSQKNMTFPCDACQQGVVQPPRQTGREQKRCDPGSAMHGPQNLGSSLAQIRGTWAARPARKGSKHCLKRKQLGELKRHAPIFPFRVKENRLGSRSITLPYSFFGVLAMALRRARSLQQEL